MYRFEVSASVPVGRRVHYILLTCLIRVPALWSCCMNAVGMELPVLSVALDALHFLREELAQLFGRVCVEPVSVGQIQGRKPQWTP